MIVRSFSLKGCVSKRFSSGAFDAVPSPSRELPTLRLHVAIVPQDGCVAQRKARDSYGAISVRRDHARVSYNSIV